VYIIYISVQTSIWLTQFTKTLLQEKEVSGHNTEIRPDTLLSRATQ